MSSTPETVQSLEGLDLPSPGTWLIDPAHSTVSFSIRHLMLSKVRGRFNSFQGTIEVAVPPEESRVEATIDVASLDTADPGRDAHVKSAEFLDVEQYPTITFTAHGPIRTEGTGFTLTGDLTVHGITKPVTLDAEYHGVATHDFLGTRMGVSATGVINRDDFGVIYNAALETGGFVLGKELHLEIEMEAIPKA